MSARTICFEIALASALFMASADARANGRFPGASMIAFDPADASHILVSATFGLLESRDAAKSFSWTCESALSLKGQQDTVLAITASGAIVAATFDGIVRSADGCHFGFPPDLALQIVPDLSLSKSRPHELLAFHMRGGARGGYDSQVVRSIDDGQTWTKVGPPLPTELLPLTVDIAPSDAGRVYMSGRLGTAEAYASVLMRSVDGGETFERVAVPETSVERMAYIAGVHPLDADRVFVRVDDSLGTVIWSSEDGGRTLRKRFTGTGRLLGFAIAPDGGEIAFGGPNDGTWVGVTDGPSFERRSDVGPSCLAWNRNGLYACADVRQAGFSLGRLRDSTATFELLFRFDALCGQTACGAATQVGKACSGEWDVVAPTIGASCGLASSDGGRVGHVDAGSNVDGSSDVSSGPVHSSGSCSFAAPSRATCGWELPVLLALCLRGRLRGRRRDRSISRRPCGP
ncbi:MAG TPA: sialidase family protein [Polyangiaceae bacterium]|nr:sialidase family protein [Polyangiaceae bacterium]